VKAQEHQKEREAKILAVSHGARDALGCLKFFSRKIRFALSFHVRLYCAVLLSRKQISEIPIAAGQDDVIMKEKIAAGTSPANFVVERGQHHYYHRPPITPTLRPTLLAPHEGTQHTLGKSSDEA